MSWHVAYHARTKERAYELVQEKFEATAAHNPEWEILIGITRSLIAMLPDAGARNIVSVLSTGHLEHTHISRGAVDLKVALVPFEE